MFSQIPALVREITLSRDLLKPTNSGTRKLRHLLNGTEHKLNTHRLSFANLHLQLDYYHHFNAIHIHMFTLESAHQIKSDQ